MKKSIKQLVVIMVLAFATQNLIAQEENGYVKVFEDFKEQYIGAVNNQHLFYEASRKNPTANSIKFYDEDMKFIKEEKVPFTIVGTQLIQNTYQKLIDSVQVETVNDMLLVRRIVSKKDGDMAGYAYDEISWYDLDDLSKPKYTKQIKRLPNFPMMKASTYRKFLNSYKRNNLTNHFVSGNRLAYLYSTKFDGIGGAEKIGYKDINNSYYLVLMDDKLNVLYKGFISLKNDMDGVFERVTNMIMRGDDMIISTINDEMFRGAREKTETLYHYKIKNENEIEMDEIKVGEEINTKYAISLSLDGLSLAGTYYSVASKEEMRKSIYSAKYIGQGIFKYNLANKKVSNLKVFSYKSPSMIYNANVRTPPFWFGDKLVVKITAPQLKLKMKLGIRIDSFELNTFNNNLDLISKFKLLNTTNIIKVKGQYKAVGIINPIMYSYNSKNQDLIILYANGPYKEEDELTMSKKDKGSFVNQLTYSNGEFKKSTFPLPDAIKFWNRTTLKGSIYSREKFFSLPFESSFNPLIPYSDPSLFYPGWFYNNTNTQSSFISQPSTPWDEVINLIKPNN